MGLMGHRVVAWTPYGRERTVSVLGRYVMRDHLRGLVDEWWLCMNTDPDQGRDIAFANGLAAAYPGWIKLKHRGVHQQIRRPKQRNTGYFYEQMTDPDTVFIRLDDDIVYIHEDALERLARHRIEHAQGVASFALIWNNAICSWFAQAGGAIPAAGTESEIIGPPREEGKHWSHERYRWPAVGTPNAFDPVGWADGRFAVALHRLLLDRIRDGRVEESFLYQDYPITTGQQFSVSTFASLGSLYAGLPQPGVLVPDEEESWHTMHQPNVLGVPNILVGNALVAHYSFFPQQAVLNGTDVLDQYRAIAQEITV